MNIYREILYIIANASRPLGWYGIELRLGMQGIILEMKLTDILDDLVNQGLLLHECTDSHPHGVYRLTSDGGKCINS